MVIVLDLDTLDPSVMSAVIGGVAEALEYW
jgi:hypothetical protein